MKLSNDTIDTKRSANSYEEIRLPFWGYANTIGTLGKFGLSEFRNEKKMILLY